ncbi:MAG: TolC family protein [Spirosomataceae bacterium]
MKSLLISSLCILLMQELKAQSTDVYLLITAAEKNNYALKRADKRIEMERASVATAFEKPKLQFETQLGNIQNPFVLDYVVGVQQTFENPAVYRAKKAYLEAGVLTAEMQKKWEKKDLVFRLSETYFNLAHTYRMLRFIQKQDSLLLQVKKMAEVMYQTGATSRLDVSESSVALGKNQLMKSEIHEMYARYESQLKNVLGDSSLPALTFSTQDSIISPTVYFQDAGLASHPAKEWIQAEVNQLASKLAFEKKRLSPDFTLGLMNQSMQGNINQWVGLGGISIPMDKKPQKAKIQMAQVEKEKAELQLSELAVLQANEWASLYKEWTTTYERIKTLENEILPALADLQATSLLQFQVGEQDFFKWNTYQQQYFATQQVYSEALRTYRIQLAYFMYLQDKKHNEK